MLFRTFEGKLMMALRCPNVPAQKRMLIFEMEECGGKLRIMNSELSEVRQQKKYNSPEEMLCLFFASFA
jgi:hypothetical protein